MRVAVLVTPPTTAESVTLVEVATDDEVAMGKFAEVAPAATVTLAGTVAAALLLDSDMTVPPTGAAPLRVTLFPSRRLRLSPKRGKPQACSKLKRDQRESSPD